MIDLSLCKLSIGYYPDPPPLESHRLYGTQGDPKARLQSETRVRGWVKESERKAVLILFFDSWLLNVRDKKIPKKYDFYVNIVRKTVPA